MPAYRKPLDAGSGAAGNSVSGDEPQLKLGRYEVVRELGKGAMGIVYLAKDPLIGRLVALKTIRASPHAEEDEIKEFQQRFVREAQAAGILNHPAIVTVHDIGQDDAGTNFIAMEYVEGQNLKEVLAQGRTLTFEQIGEIIAQVGEALDFAHSKGIVHRDVKPANVILVEGHRAKIMDFGIAKIASGIGGNLTTTGQFLGTPNYMAPEQIKGTPVDGRTDLFSLGICLYECLTRRKPFGGDSLTSISYKIVHEPFPPLHEINPQIPDGFEEVVANCLAKDPAKRYQRGREVALALRAVIRGERPANRALEPMLAEETITTLDRDRAPTVEMAYPDARPTVPESIPVGSSPRLAAPMKASSAPAQSASQPRMRQSPAASRLNETFTRVRAYPAWRKKIPAPAFLVIVALLVAGLSVAVVTIRKRQPKVPAIDTMSEARRARERELRKDANTLLQQGRVADAYMKYEELSRLAPNSPAITGRLMQLSAIRSREDIARAQGTLAKMKVDEGIALFNQKRYAEAIPALQVAYSLNPNDSQTVIYLKSAQQAQQKLDEAKFGPRTPLPPTSTAVVTGTVPQKGSTVPPITGRAAANALARFTTVFNSPFSEGWIMVKAGADTVAHENLFEERGRFIRRKYPRTISVTRDLTPKNTDLHVWVVVPSLNIQEHHVIRHNFLPGSMQRLTVSYNGQKKTFDYQMN